MSITTLDPAEAANPDETDAQVKIIIQGKISEYLMRAEVVKTHLKETSMGNIATPDHLTVGFIPLTAHNKFMRIQCAIENAREGIEEDEKHNYFKAYKLYQSSLDYFMLALKCKLELIISPTIIIYISERRNKRKMQNTHTDKNL